MRLSFFFLPLLLALPGLSATFTFSGSLVADDGSAEVLFTNLNTRTVSLTTRSFQLGGFDPYLSVFGGGGELLAMEDNGGCPPAQADGYCGDAALRLPDLPAGNYRLILTQAGNVPTGPYLSDGFSQAGNPSYTGDGLGLAGVQFVDGLGRVRSSEWSLELDGPDSANAANVAPEPGSASLMLLAIGLPVLGVKLRGRV